MSQHNRYAVVIDGTQIVNTLVIPEGQTGDEMLAENDNWVEVTDMRPRPGVGNGWTYVKGSFVEPPVPAKTREQVEAERRVAYQNESDPIFFEYQRGEKTQEEWLASIEAVKQAHPYPLEV